MTYKSKNSKLLLSLAVSLVLGIGQAADYAYEWNDASPSLSFGSGIVALQLVDGGSTITSMTVSARCDDSISFSGDRMDFATGAEIVVNGGSLVFSNEVDAVGDIAVKGAVPPPHWYVSSTDTLYSDALTTVLENYDLGNIRVTGGHLTHNASGYAEPYHVKRGTTGGVAWMEFQLQQWLGTGTSTRVVKIHLEQVGPNIGAKTVYAKYETTKVNALGHDFDTGSKSNFVVSAYNLRSTTANPAYHYGCNGLDFEFEREQCSARVLGAFSCGGNVYVENGMRLDVADQQALVIPSVSVTTNAKFVVAADIAAPMDLPSAEVACGYVPETGIVFAANRNIWEIQIDTIQGKLAGLSLSTTPIAAWTGYFRWTGKTMLSFEVQVTQAGSSLAKGIMAHLEQVGPDVVVVADGAYYYTGTAGTHSYENTSIRTKYTYASGTNTTGYCLGALSATFRSHSGSQVTLSGASSSSGGEVLVSGNGENRHAELVIMNSNALPSNGVVRVGQNGMLTLLANSSMTRGMSGGRTEFYVGPGGSLRQGGDGPMADTFHYANQLLTVDGGTVEFGYGIVSKWDSATSADAVDTYGSTYLNYLTLKNGARCFGRAVRVGNHNALWTVAGTSPSTWDGDISLLALTGLGQAWVEFAVDDCTSSDAVDFTVTGSMKMFKPDDSDNYKMLHVTKTGVGTMLVNGTTDFKAYPLDISGGVWMVGSDGTMNTEQNITLNSGSFATADGVCATVGALSTGASGGGIVVGTNSAVCFADSSSQTWSGPVSITLAPGGKVRFGTSDAALTPGQITKLRCNGRRVLLDANGYVVPPGMLLIYR